MEFGSFWHGKILLNKVFLSKMAAAGKENFYLLCKKILRCFSVLED